jgi:hypothetical protein
MTQRNKLNELSSNHFGAGATRMSAAAFALRAFATFAGWAAVLAIGCRWTATVFVGTFLIGISHNYTPSFLRVPRQPIQAQLFRSTQAEGLVLISSARVAEPRGPNVIDLRVGQGSTSEY